MMFTVNKPRRINDVNWRLDGEKDQIIILSKDGFALPVILNPTAARIFLLCNGENSLQDITYSLCKEFKFDDFAVVLEDVKKQIDDFVEQAIVEV